MVEGRFPGVVVEGRFPGVAAKGGVAKLAPAHGSCPAKDDADDSADAPGPTPGMAKVPAGEHGNENTNYPPGWVRSGYSTTRTEL